MSTAITTLLSNLRTLAAGPSGAGLTGEAFSTWAQDRPTPELVQLWQNEEAGARKYSRETEAANRAAQAAQEKALQDAADEGRRAEAYDPNTDKILLAFAESWSKYSRTAAHDRMGTLANILHQRYQMSGGEPEELKKLRAELRAAMKARAPLSKAIAEAREAYKYAHDAEAEAVIVAAQEALSTAQRNVELIRSAIWQGFGIRVVAA